MDANSTVVFPERFEWYMIRNGFLGPEYSSKLGSLLIGIILIIYDGVTRKRLDYLISFLPFSMFNTEEAVRKAKHTPNSTKRRRFDGRSFFPFIQLKRRSPMNIHETIKNPHSCEQRMMMAGQNPRTFPFSSPS